MNIIQFFFTILQRLNLPVGETEMANSAESLSAAWDAVDVEGEGFVPKAKKILDSPVAKIAFAVGALLVANKIANYLNEKFGDADGDGDVDPLDAIYAILHKHQQQKGA